MKGRVRNTSACAEKNKSVKNEGKMTMLMQMKTMHAWKKGNRNTGKRLVHKKFNHD